MLLIQVRIMIVTQDAWTLRTLIHTVNFQAATMRHLFTDSRYIIFLICYIYTLDNCLQPHFHLRIFSNPWAIIMVEFLLSVSSASFHLPHYFVSLLRHTHFRNNSPLLHLFCCYLWGFQANKLPVYQTVWLHIIMSLLSNKHPCFTAIYAHNTFTLPSHVTVVYI